MFLALLLTASAGSHGLVIRLSLPEPTSETVVVTLQGEETKEVEVKDNGASPDLVAGDNVWAGTTLVQSDTVQIRVRIGEKIVEGGSVSWEPDRNVCDLDLKIEGGQLTASATTPLPPTPTAPLNGAAPTGIVAPSGAPPPTLTADESSEKLPDSSLSIAAGFGFLLLAGLLYLGWSGNSPRLPSLPEPGFLDPLLPSLSILSSWEVSEKEQKLLADQLLPEMARHHRILLMAPAEYQPVAVMGGPVYRAPRAWKKALLQLAEEGGLPLVVLWVGSSVDPLQLKKALPEGVGGILLGKSVMEGVPKINCLKDEERWHFFWGDDQQKVMWSAKRPENG